MAESRVGALELPVPAGTARDKLEDPIIEEMLSFGAFCLKDALDQKLHNLVGTPSDAVPVDNRFSFDPMHPRGHHVKLPLPALFMWWDGESTAEQWSSIYYMRIRMIHVLYAFSELPGLEEMIIRAGLLNAVDATFHRMSLWRSHPDYKNGQSIRSLVAPTCQIEWFYLGGAPGRFGIDEGPLAHRRAAKTSGRDFNALKGRFRVHERVTPRDLTEDDYMQDMEFDIKAADGEHSETIDFMSRTLTAPDGTEDL